jgi:Transglutaminase-like superfamily
LLVNYSRRVWWTQTGAISAANLQYQPSAITSFAKEIVVAGWPPGQKTDLLRAPLVRLTLDSNNRMIRQADIDLRSENLKPTEILDFDQSEVQELVKFLLQSDQLDRTFLQKAHAYLSQILLPVYSVNEWQPVSKTLRNRQGSCSQRMACLEAIARAAGIATRVRALQVRGAFWYPRFRHLRNLIPKRILLVWPQFLLDEAWLDFDELYSPMTQLVATATSGFTNVGESIFEAVQHTPVDFFGKTCGLACARPEHDLSKFLIEDDGFFNSRDEVFKRFGSFQYTMRGRLFELFFGGRKSS